MAEASALMRDEPHAAERVEQPQPAADTYLYLDGVTVSFDGFRALNDLSLVIEQGRAALA